MKRILKLRSVISRFHRFTRRSSVEIKVCRSELTEMELMWYVWALLNIRLAVASTIKSIGCSTGTWGLMWIIQRELSRKMKCLKKKAHFTWFIADICRNVLDYVKGYLLWLLVCMNTKSLGICMCVCANHADDSRDFIWHLLHNSYWNSQKTKGSLTVWWAGSERLCVCSLHHHSGGQSVLSFLP